MAIMGNYKVNNGIFINLVKFLFQDMITTKYEPVQKPIINYNDDIIMNDFLEGKNTLLHIYNII